MKIQVLPKKEDNKTIRKKSSDINLATVKVRENSSPKTIKQKFLSVPVETSGLDGYDMLMVHGNKLSQPTGDNKNK